MVQSSSPSSTTRTERDIFPRVKFEIFGEIRGVQTIASGHGIRILDRLIRLYGKGTWRKLKGVATVRFEDGTMIEAEVHWFEAHGIGKKEFKRKRYLD